MRKRFLSIAICTCMVISFVGCNKNEDSKTKTTENTEESAEEAVKLTDVSQMADFEVSYTDSDEVPDWEKSNTQIKLNGSDVEVTGNGASFKDSVITITKAGYYVFSGELDNGKIVIQAGEKDKVYLIFNGVKISCSDDAVINETTADKVIITAVEGSQNILSDGETHSDEEITAAIYCKDSITINGTGTLIVNGNYNDGITSKDKFKLIDATLDIVAVDDGIVGKDLVAVKSGTLKIDSIGDGMKSTKTTDIEQGIICVDGGTITINSELDAMQAENFVKINAGTLNLITGGSSTNESTSGTEGEILDNRNPESPDLDSNAQILSGNSNVQGSLLTADSDSTGDTNNDVENNNQMFPDKEPPEKGDMPIGDGNGGPDGDMHRKELPTNEDGEIVDMEIPTNENGEFEKGDRPYGGKGESDWGDWGQKGKGGPEMNNEDQTNTEDTPSAKGVKGGNGVYITGGTINIDSSDDAIHSNDMVYILDGTMSISSGDDGIHADTTLNISGGTIDITKSYEGIEAYYITISGGDIILESRDDGLNAAGGNDASSTNGRPGQNQFEAGDSDASITIQGGSIQIKAEGDGIDSNGNIVMTDGKVIVCGPESGGNGMLDYSGSFTMNGGTLLGAGSSSMFQSISSGSKLSVINAQISGDSGDEISIYDGEQKIAEFISTVRYSMIIISTPDLETGKSYTVKYGSQETTVEATDAVDYSGMR